MKILGLKVIGHDTGAALITDDRIVVIQQERLDRKKYSSNFPIESINYCLKEAGLDSLEKIDAVAIEQFEKSADGVIKSLVQHNLWDIIKDKVYFIPHHDAHAASAFFCSPFEKSAIMVVDNAGMTTLDKNGKLQVETESFYSGEGNRITLIQRNFHPLNNLGQLNGTSGVGNFYTQITRFINFGKHEEGKTMGLAPFGTDVLSDKIPESEFILKINPLKYTFQTPLEPHPLYNFKYLFKKSAFSRKKAWLSLLKIIFSKNKQNLFKKTPDVFLKGRRPKEIKLPDDFYTNLAFWAQSYIEKVMIDYANELYKITKSKKLCIAGGVGLNSVANKKILDSSPFDEIFIQPASGDSGLPLGCALWLKHQILKMPITWRMRNAYLGRDYDEGDIINAIKQENVKFEKINNPEKIASELLSQNKIIGWYQGRSELGPRALGNRSILCSPIPKDMKDKINAQVKHREGFRPFAPIVLEESKEEYFDLNQESPFMLLIAKVKKKNIPAVTHIDGTGRVQTIKIDQNEKLYSLIKNFESITGVPVILNTSFNDNGEPIVETPLDAIKSFKRTNLDALFIHNYLIYKQ